MKYVGYRCLLAVGGGEARTYTRSGQDWSDRFAVLTEAARAIDARSALIDGEIVALDDEGRPSFQRLHAGIKEGSADPEIGSATGRERVCRYVSISVVAVSFKKKKNTN